MCGQARGRWKGRAGFGCWEAWVQMGLVDSGAGTGRRRGAVCQAEHPTLTLQDWTCPPPYPQTSLGFLVWEPGPEPDAGLNRGSLAPRLRVECSWLCIRMRAYVCVCVCE